MKTVKKYIIIDDDPFNNTLGTIVLKKALGEVNTITFTEPEKGLDYIQTEYNANSETTILFLDINMPVLTGWEFMKYYEKFPEEVKAHIIIYILSSSVDYRDKENADTNPYIKGFISKPLNKETIIALSQV